MYRLSRLLLILSALAAAYCVAVVIVIGWPVSGLIAAFLAAVRASNKAGFLTTLGSARWAGVSELQQAGMLDGQGIILGRVRVGRWQSLRLHDAKRACRQFFKPWREVVLSKAIHTAVFSPSGGGKGVSCVIPFLLTCSESCCCVDFKGENFRITAEHRRKAFGHRIVVLDPFHVVTKQPDTFNALDFIDKDNPQAIDECNNLANALVIRTGEEKEPHWADSAEAWISAFLACVVQFGVKESDRSLQTIRDLLSDPQRLEMSIKLMCESDCWQGMLSRMGGQLQHFVEKERASVLTTVSRHLRFLDTLAVAASTNSSSFDPAELKKGRMTVYLVLPPEHMRAQSALLRMWIGSLLRAVVRQGLDERRKVHFVLDEAASLGHLEAIDDAVDKYRGYGIRLQFYFQSLGQLKKCFPQGQDQTLLSNTSQVFFGVNDNATADYVSARLGERTIVVDSGGYSRGRSDQQSYGPQHSSTGTSDNQNQNWSQQARKLLKPEEIMTLPPREAITFVTGMRPIRTTLIRYYEEKGLGRKESFIRRAGAACWMLMVSVVLFGVLSLVGAALTAELKGESDVQVFREFE